MRLPIFQVGTFTVCLLEHWLPDELMRQIALENAVAETVLSFECAGWVRDPLFYPGNQDGPVRGRHHGRRPRDCPAPAPAHTIHPLSLAK